MSAGLLGVLIVGATSSVAVTTGLAPARGDNLQGLAVSVELDTRIAVTDRLCARVGWGLAHGRLETPSVGALRSFDLANLQLGLAYPFRIGPATLELELTAGAPLALLRGSIPDKRATEFTLVAATSARGWRRPFRWALGTAPLVAGAALNLPLAPRLRGGLTVRPAFLISVNRRPSGAALQTEAELALDLEPVELELSYGLFIRQVPLQNTDRTQQSVRLRAAWTVTTSWSVGAEVALNLGAPYGVNAEGSTLGVGAAIGATLSL